MSSLSASKSSMRVAEGLAGAVGGERGVDIRRRLAPARARSRRERSPARSRAPAAPAPDMSGVLPPSTMLASSGAWRRAPAAMRASCSGSSAPRRTARRRPPRGRARRARCARLEALDRDRVGAGDDQRLARMRAHRRAALILPTISAAGIERLAVEVAAALGEVLVLELDGVGAGALEQRAPCARH